MNRKVVVAAVGLLGVSLALLMRSPHVSIDPRQVVLKAGDPISIYSEQALGLVTVPAIVRTAAEWRGLLTPLQYQVSREAGTERAFSGRYWNEHAAGMYVCSSCGTDLFRSETKYDSGTGWPSFWEPIAGENVVERSDWYFGLRRTEVLCRRCGAHLGHVFDDRPPPMSLRYSMNSASLRLVPR